jgi:hypothetical protein
LDVNAGIQCCRRQPFPDRRQIKKGAFCDGENLFSRPWRNKRERRIKVSKPAANAIESITKALADTWEVKIAVIACLPHA